MQEESGKVQLPGMQYAILLARMLSLVGMSITVVVRSGLTGVQEHRACSEGFYKSVIEDEIRSNPDRSTEERRSMMEILQRLSDPDTLGGPPDSDDDGTSEDEGGLENLDIGKRLLSNMLGLTVCRNRRLRRSLGCPVASTKRSV